MLTPTLPPPVAATPGPVAPLPALAGRHYPVAIVGGGQAGLSISYCLKARGIDHVILERHRLGEAWRSQRWDSFCLVTPNWQCYLPGFAYAGDDPYGFMKKDAIVGYVEAYARFFQPPLHEGVAVTGLRRHERGFQITSDAGAFTASQVVVATGGYHTPSIPRLAERFANDVMQIHSVNYKKSRAASAR